MNLPEWTAAMIAELTAAGFTATDHRGFPLVDTPRLIEEKERLLRFTTTLPAERRVYAEGMLYLPAGTDELCRREGIARLP